MASGCKSASVRDQHRRVRVRWIKIKTVERSMRNNYETRGTLLRFLRKVNSLIAGGDVKVCV